MAIPEAQLDTWSNRGAAVGSAETYQQIKSVLEDTDAPYAARQFEVFLQGSYGNQTNIYSESDVDIVIHLLSSFIYDTNLLPMEQKALVPTTMGGGITYGVDQFKREVFSHLKARYGTDAVIGNRSIKIKANGNRRSADVIVCMGYRQYIQYTPHSQPFYAGVLFKDAGGNEIVNYPKYHKENCITKNQATNQWFKPTVRIFKNLRSRLIANGQLNDGDAPSYFVEGMLWNIPEAAYGQSYQLTVAKCIDWLNACDATQLLCANKMYFLLNPASPVTWRQEKFRAFLDASVDLWNDW